MSEWKPIESAPRDGTRVLTYDASFGCCISWYGKDFNVNGKHWLTGNGDDFSTGFYYTPIEPTYWQHLPQPPKEEKA